MITRFFDSWIGDNGGEDFSNDSPAWIVGAMAGTVLLCGLCGLIYAIIRWIP